MGTVSNQPEWVSLEHIHKNYTIVLQLHLHFATVQSRQSNWGSSSHWLLRRNTRRVQRKKIIKLKTKTKMKWKKTPSNTEIHKRRFMHFNNYVRAECFIADSSKKCWPARARPVASNKATNDEERVDGLRPQQKKVILKIFFYFFFVLSSHGF